MATQNQLYSRFTDENYVTKQGFFSALGTSLVEKLWDGVVNYRVVHSFTSRLRTVSQLPFRLTRTEALMAKYAAFEGKLFAVKEEYEKLGAMEEERSKAERGALYNCLRYACDLEGVKISEPTLRTMLTPLFHDEGNSFTAITGYRDYLRQNLGVAFASCESFFVEFFSALSGTDELTIFYRVSDSTVGSGRAGDYVKYNDIESVVAGLEDFVRNEKMDSVEKAMLAMYFVSYVLPFAAHNSLAAVALGKKLLSRYGLGEAAYLLPLESLMFSTPKSKEPFDEAAKTGDFTYVLLYYIEALTPLLDNMLNDWTKLRTDALKREFRSEMREEPVKPVAPVLTPVESKEEAPKPVEVVLPKEPTHVIEEVPPVIEPSVEEADEEPEEPVEIYVEEEEEPRAIEEKPVEEVPVLESLPYDSRSVFAPKVSLSDKEVKMAARYIVETHPDISKQQALFFASHSTIGRYYTIQDYKRTMKVAYETARTSMDRLAQAKLYKKLRIKNKFVYTPRHPGEKE